MGYGTVGTKNLFFTLYTDWRVNYLSPLFAAASQTWLKIQRKLKTVILMRLTLKQLPMQLVTLLRKQRPPRPVRVRSSMRLQLANLLKKHR